MIPLEMKGMVRYCHPPTLSVGLTRQSCDPKRTLQYQKAAKKKRDKVCFPRMLRTMTSKFQPYRLIRRLWMKAFRCILRGHCSYLMNRLMDHLDYVRIKPIPDHFTTFHLETFQQIYVNYENLSTPIRFRQLAGRLVTLGYPQRDIPAVDYEYESYLSKFKHCYHTNITDLYQHLTRKNIPKKWHIILSYLPFNLYYGVEHWEDQISSNKLTLTLHAFQRQHDLSQEESILMTSWIDQMKYPSY
jgi:hypothetical protein